MVVISRKFITLSLWALCLASPCLFSQSPTGEDEVPYKNLDEVMAIQWDDLMTEENRDAILNAPPVSHFGWGWRDQLRNGPEQDAYMQAMQSFDVNPELIGKRVLLPGFVVPTAYNEDRQVTEFFLVPFFGACIHVPPPPPNQIIHVIFDEGLELDDYYDAYVVLGELTAQVVRNELANSAYSLKAEGVEIYTN